MLKSRILFSPFITLCIGLFLSFEDGSWVGGFLVGVALTAIGFFVIDAWFEHHYPR